MAREQILRGCKSERGSVLLETALTLPLLLLVAVGIFEFGRAYQTQQVITNAAREGARIAVLPGTQSSDVQARVKEYMQQGLLPRYEDATVTVSGSSIPMGASSVSASVVTVNYPFEFMVIGPVVRLVSSDSTLGSGPITLTALAEMRNETQF